MESDDWDDDGYEQEPQEADAAGDALALIPEFSWLDHGEDVWISVMQYLDLISCKSLSFVCKDLNSIASHFYGDWTFFLAQKKNCNFLLRDLAKSHAGVLSIKSMSSLLNLMTEAEFIGKMKELFASQGVEPQDAFPRLRHVDLSQSYRMTYKTLEAMAPYWSQVRVLDISSTLWPTWGETHEAISNSLSQFKNLRVLRASAAFVLDRYYTGASATNLATLLQPIASQLQEIRLSNCGINDKSFKEIFGTVKFPRLEILWLRNNWRLSDESAELLVKVLEQNAHSMQEISLRNSRLTSTAIDLLKRSFPNAKIDMGLQATAEALAVQSSLMKRFQ